ncbi:MAG: IclR family transcriptional regulator C-terminal domain-containing protein [Alphaproteobacteria bacterium]|nr:IclR family transcriptional regulator [Magnetovibrio sp.]HBT40547.1 IclR family transcriptional regulator [Rhodospirillaceae bacterium]HCS70169.1 IclR family transcriptional regulator [Rhodospirillaceae bacterium]|tara:strand:- start:48093 stop:48923 length:831 start_codon:yes stop_codon:yes gene_type:complete
MADTATPRPRTRGRTRTRSREDTGGQVQSLARAISILKALARSDDGMTLTDVALTVVLPPSTTHRLLTTMQHDRIVRFDQATALWHVGVEAFVIGNAFIRSRDLVVMARPIMRRLMEETGETVKLGIQDDGEVIYLAQVESRETMRAYRAPGTRVPMHCSGVGKALLANQSEEEVNRILQRHGLSKVTDKTLATPVRFRDALGQIRRQGYALDDEEHAIGLRCIAAAVFNEHDEPIAAISVSGPSARISDEKIAGLAGLVTRAAKAIASELGSREP